MQQQPPGTFLLDVTGANGTPFRFVATPADGALRYYDRRHTLAEGEPGYGINRTCEIGQACGPALRLIDAPEFACIRGWHGVTDWDVDAGTTTLVSAWVRHVLTHAKEIEAWEDSDR